MFSSNFKLDLETDPIDGNPEGQIRKKKTLNQGRLSVKKKLIVGLISQISNHNQRAHKNLEPFDQLDKRKRSRINFKWAIKKGTNKKPNPNKAERLST